MRRLLAGGAMLALALALYLVLRPAPRVDGQVWRQGWFAGSELRLLRDHRYELGAFSRLGRGETRERGHWTRLGDVVSLVPSTPGVPPRLLKQAVDGERRTLTGPGANETYELH